MLEQPPLTDRRPLRLKRAWVPLALALAAALAIGALLALGGGRTDAQPPARRPGLRARHVRPPAAASNPSPSGTHTSSGGPGRVGAPEVRDPEEAKSFPEPASVHHRAAYDPAAAGEQIVAAGAASDAEVRKELGEEGGSLDSYLSILENFLKESEPTAPQPTNSASLPNSALPKITQ